MWRGGGQAFFVPLPGAPWTVPLRQVEAFRFHLPRAEFLGLVLRALYDFPDHDEYWWRMLAGRALSLAADDFRSAMGGRHLRLVAAEVRSLANKVDPLASPLGQPLFPFRDNVRYPLPLDPIFSVGVASTAAKLAKRVTGGKRAAELVGRDAEATEGWFFSWPLLQQRMASPRPPVDRARVGRTILLLILDAALPGDAFWSCYLRSVADRIYAPPARPFMPTVVDGPQASQSFLFFSFTPGPPPWPGSHQ